MESSQGRGVFIDARIREGPSLKRRTYGPICCSKHIRYKSLIYMMNIKSITCDGEAKFSLEPTKGTQDQQLI
jgi:hypothetical protein